MSIGVTMSGNIAYLDSLGITDSLAIDDILATLATYKKMKHIQSIGTSEEAIVLGECTSPGWAIFVNVDPTNFIELRVATGGAKFAKLLPGEFALLRLGSGAQAPFAIADTAACLMHYFLVQT